MSNFTVQITAEEAKLTRIALVRLMGDRAYLPERDIMDNFCRYLLEKQVEADAKEA